MEKKLEKLMDMLISTLEKGGDLIGEHVPKIVEEILAYEFMYSATFAGVFIFLFLLCLLCWGFAGYQSVKNPDDLPKAIIWTVFSIGLFMIGAVVQSHAKDVIKIKMAPRVYTIEYLRDFKAGR